MFILSEYTYYHYETIIIFADGTSNCGKQFMWAPKLEYTVHMTNQNLCKG